MNTRELIRSEIDEVPEERLEELFGLVRTFTQKKNDPEQTSIFDRLKNVSIEGPADFSTNFAQYTSGEKNFEKGIS